MGGSAFKTFEEQALQLRDRGCLGGIEEMISALSSINYYRLSAYWYPFRESNPNYAPEDNASRPKLDRFVEGTTWADIVSCYKFDDALKFHAFCAIEHIEVALRTKTAYYWSASRGKRPNPQAELDSGFLERIQKAYEASREECVKHQKEVVGITHVKDLPVWVFVELTTFSDLQVIYKTFEDSLRMRIAQCFGFKTISSFQSTISLVREARNICAHYARFWNRSWTVGVPDNALKKPKKPLLKKHTDADILKHSWNETARTWEECSRGGNKHLSRSKTASVLVILAFLDRKITGTNAWATGLFSVFKSHELPTRINLAEEIGFVGDWKTHPVFI